MHNHKELLKLIWAKGLYSGQGLKTVGGAPVEVIDRGTANRNSGTLESLFDISGVVVSIGDTQYRGNVAVSSKASDVKDMHPEESAIYDNIILLVVGDADAVVCRSDGSVIPTAEIKYPADIDRKYGQLTNQNTAYGCAPYFARFRKVDKYAYLTRLTVERLERKHNDFRKLYEESDQNWYEAFYITLFATMGAGSNKEAYVRLAGTVPYHLLTRMKDSVEDMEALLLGGSGLLAVQYPDEYTSLLMKRFEELRKAFQITPMRYNDWDLSASKPNHHPVVRIVELASLFAHREFLFAQLMECKTPRDVGAVFSVEASDYWTTHFVPSAKSEYSVKRIGSVMLNILTINLVVPMIATYGKIYNNDELLDRAIELLEKSYAERNRYTIGWEAGGIELENAFFTQGLIQLSREYCEKKRCTECNIGEIFLCS